MCYNSFEYRWLELSTDSISFVIPVERIIDKLYVERLWNTVMTSSIHISNVENIEESIQINYIFILLTPQNILLPNVMIHNKPIETKVNWDWKFFYIKPKSNV